MYVDERSDHITDPAVLSRIRALAIPPAWTDVWICPRADGHIQATGRDDRGRKQYIYHSNWDRIRSETKFNRLIPFGEALPDIRRQCHELLSGSGLTRERVLATVVTLLDRTLIRVGNVEYARHNDSYGLTTLRDKHVAFEGQSLTFSFRGKSGKKHVVRLNDRRLARIVRKCRDIPGFELFQYYDEDGARSDVGSGDVNQFLQELTGADFTAKDFRTWGGSVRAAEILYELGPATSKTDARRKLAEMNRLVGAELGNTPAICRDYYVHPLLPDLYECGELAARWDAHRREPQVPGLEPGESALLRLLKAA